MIVRDYISCQICGHPHTLRVYVGKDSFQKHTFRCGNCGEAIEVGMEVDYSTVSTRIVPLSNCATRGSPMPKPNLPPTGGVRALRAARRRAVPSVEESGTIVTLSPDMVVPDDLQGKEYAFPFLFESQRILKENPTYAEELEESTRPAQEAYEEWVKGGQLPPGPLHDWEFAGRVWSLFLNGRHDVCEAYIEREYARYRYAEQPDIFQVIYAFCALIGRGQARQVFEALSTQGEVARAKSCQHLEDFRDYYVRHFAHDLLKGSHEIASEYMKNYSEYSQVLIYMDSGASMGDLSRPSSSAFNDTKMFYGNAFEHLARHFVLPACLNNIVQGRPYDMFERLTLQEYLDLNKASKARSFQDNASLSTIAEGLNNKIRNASHHRRMEFDANTGTVIYLPSESGDYDFISYGNYLMLCNSILQKIAGLTCFVIAALRPEELFDTYQ